MTGSGKVFLVGAGPGDPDLLTVKAVRVLSSVDVVLHDDLVSTAVLALANQRACIVNVGKRCGRKSISQSGIHQLMIDCARRSLSVARLKSGDPMVFGRAAEEMEALRGANLEFEVVPGITAAFAAAAAIPCSLTDRRAASSITLRSGHHANDSRLEEAEPTRVVYMPGRDLSSLANEWLAEGLSGHFPCVVISQASQPAQEIVRTRLSELASTRPGPPPVLVIGGWVLRTADPMIEDVSPVAENTLRPLEDPGAAY